MDWNLKPQVIEDRSFSIIAEEAGDHSWDNKHWSVIKRLVHTSADFDYVKNTVISPGAIEIGV
ncbi:MAG: precorrin-8X methylmutase, partial [Candidatus Adiutrix sp.]